MKEINGIMEFLKRAEQLKSTLRSSHTATGRPESVAEHTWRLSLMAILLQKYYPDTDFEKLIKILVIHDMGEIINGDVPAIYQDPGVDKSLEERIDFESILDPLPNDLREEMLGLWDEYNEVSSEEAKLAKALDKLETLLQHLHGKNEDDFDYEFNLDYGKNIQMVLTT